MGLTFTEFLIFALLFDIFTFFHILPSVNRFPFSFTLIHIYLRFEVNHEFPLGVVSVATALSMNCY